MNILQHQGGSRKKQLRFLICCFQVPKQLIYDEHFFPYWYLQWEERQGIGA